MASAMRQSILNGRRFVAGMEMSQTQGEGLFGDVASGIKRVQRVGEPVVKNCQTRNVLSKDLL